MLAPTCSARGQEGGKGVGNTGPARHLSPTNLPICSRTTSALRRVLAFPVGQRLRRNSRNPCPLRRDKPCSSRYSERAACDGSISRCINILDRADALQGELAQRFGRNAALADEGRRDQQSTELRPRKAGWRGRSSIRSRCALDQKATEIKVTVRGAAVQRICLLRVAKSFYWEIETR